MWSVSLTSHPSLAAHKYRTACSTSGLLTWSVSRHLAASLLYPGSPSLPPLPVWMNVSSLTPWLSDFHTGRFSGSSDCFLFFNLLLSFFLLCEEAQCMYLCLHLGQTSPHFNLPCLFPRVLGGYRGQPSHLSALLLTK